MGSGKSTVGKLLAERLKYKHIDTDHIIEETQGLSITRIFDAHGESKFRELEENVIDKISKLTDVVVSTGGGIILNPINTMRLKEMGTVIYLKASLKQLETNLSDSPDNRPLLKTHTLAVLLKVRESLYTNAAHFCIDIDGKTIEEITSEILKIQRL
ncbi:MAG TPA: shikimate kinase, partial [Fusibacter sp.]|nr:shikimate kinase [Fusibacter sp.]